MGVRYLFNKKGQTGPNGTGNVLLQTNYQIIADEEGTTVAAVTMSLMSSRMASFPFLYLILEMESGLVLFASQGRNPKAD